MCRDTAMGVLGGFVVRCGMHSEFPGQGWSLDLVVFRQVVARTRGRGPLPWPFH